MLKAVRSSLTISEPCRLNTKMPLVPTAALYSLLKSSLLEPPPFGKSVRPSFKAGRRS